MAVMTFTSKTFRRCISRIVLAVVLLTASSVSADEGPPPLLRIGFMHYSFFGVDPGDARVALEVWLQQFANQIDLKYRLETVIFDNMSSVEDAIKNRAIASLGMGSWDYLKLADKVPLKPATVSILLSGLESTP